MDAITQNIATIMKMNLNISSFFGLFMSLNITIFR